MEFADDRVLVPYSLDSGTMGQRGAPRSGPQTVRTKWSSPGLAGELESLLAGNLEQLSRSRGGNRGLSSAQRGKILG